MLNLDYEIDLTAIQFKLQKKSIICKILILVVVKFSKLYKITLITGQNWFHIGPMFL